MIDTTNPIFTFLTLSLANATISYTIAKTYIFLNFRWFFREWEFLYELINCPFCISFWIAFAMCSIWDVKLTNCEYPILDFFISSFAMVMTSGFIWGHFYKITNL